MDTLDSRALKDAAHRSLANASCNPKKLVLTHTGIILLASLVLTVVDYLLEKGMSSEQMIAVLAEAKAEREAGVQVLVVQMNKNKKFQKEQLAKDGYTDVKEFFKNK